MINMGTTITRRGTKQLKSLFYFSKQASCLISCDCELTFSPQISFSNQSMSNHYRSLYSFSTSIFIMSRGISTRWPLHCTRKHIKNLCFYFAGWLIRFVVENVTAQRAELQHLLSAVPSFFDRDISLCVRLGASQQVTTGQFGTRSGPSVPLLPWAPHEGFHGAGRSADGPVSIAQ